MKRIAVVLALILSAGVAGAQTTTGWGQKWLQSPQGAPPFVTNYGDTTGYPLSGNTSGQQSVTNPADNNGLWSNTDIHALFTRQFTSAGQMDSNQVAADTRGYRRLWLFCIGTFDSLTQKVVFGVQVRAHLNSATDSIAAIPWYRWGRDGSTAISDVDSIGQSTRGPYLAAQSDSMWSSEFKLSMDVERQVGNYLNNTHQGIGAAPRGMWIPLVDRSGAWYWGPYTSVRFRCQAPPKSRFVLSVTLVGSYQ